MSAPAQVRPSAEEAANGEAANASQSAGSATLHSESRPSHTRATTSQSPPVDDTLRLPKFKKNQRHIDISDHSRCCALVPPGRESEATPGVLVRNSIGLQGHAAVNAGTRDHMEDRHVIAYGKPKGLFKAFFGVFDGHGGEEASHFAGEHLATYVQEELERSYRDKLGMAHPGPDAQGNTPLQHYEVEEAALREMQLDYKEALQRAFDRLEDSVLRQSRHIGCRDGTTVTSVLVAGDTLYCANTGDSRTVLCRDASAMPLSNDHKPSSDEERARILAAGGEVRAVMLDRAAFCCFKAKKVPHGAERLWPGGFSVSRAVGDIDYKDLRRKKTHVLNVLIHRPDVTATNMSSRDQFIVCGSDGLYDVMTNQQVIDFVGKELRKKRRSDPVEDISQKLADQAYSLGSEDNITVLIMYFANNTLPFKM